jgi:Secretion system C-terminal sorting domain/PKD domain/Beta-propeller repeat
MFFYQAKTHYLRLFLLLITVGAFQIKTTAQVNVLWESRYTNTGNNSDTGKELALDDNGNIYVTGTSWTSATNGFDIVTVKYDPLGVQQWINTLNGTGSGLDDARNIVVDASSNSYVTGYTASTGGNFDYITIKYDAAGVQQWAVTYNGGGNGFDEAYDIAVDPSGNVYVTGSSDNGAQGSNFVTIKYNSAGVQQWATPYNGPGNSIDAATEIALDNLQNVYVTGRSFGSTSDLDIATIKYDNAGVQQWVSRFDGALNFFDVPEAIHLDNLNNVYVAGATYGGLATENDYVTIKINNAGVQQWAQIEDGPLNEGDKAFDVITDLNQNVYVTGRSMGAGGTAENILTFKYDSTGTLLWQDTYNGPSSGYDEGQQMALGNSGALYLTGYSAGNGTNNDYLTLKYDTGNGSILWEARFDGPASNSDQAFAMEIDASESIYVTGTSKGSSSGQDYSTIKWCQLTAVASNDTQICTGDSTQLNVSATGGINYLWLPNVGLDDNTVASPMAFPTTTTTYIVSATNGVGCVDFDTVTVNVNSLPSNSITPSGATTFCAGDSVILTVDPSSSYSWNTGDSTQSITVFNGGNYTVTVTDSNTCAISGQQTVIVNTLPNVSAGSDANVCDGSSIQLNASGATNYTWNTQITLSDSTIANPIATPTIQTTYWVIGTDLNGCENSDSVFIAVSVSPTAIIDVPIPNDTLYLSQPNGGDIQFFSTPSINALTFDWDFGDGGTDNIPNPQYTYLGPGYFKVTMAVTNGQCVDTATTNIKVFLVFSVEEQQKSEIINVYPNPAKDFITININGDKKMNNISLLNSLGQEVKTYSYKNVKSLTLFVNEFDAGIYFLKIKVEDKILFKKISISH